MYDLNDLECGGEPIEIRRGIVIYVQLYFLYHMVNCTVLFSIYSIHSF